LSLFQQRKNPRKIAWTIVYRRMHKKGLTEEVAKKRSRKTVKHQRGIVGADLAAIAAKRNQTAQIRVQQRQAAITKAKADKKDKEAKKPKVRRALSARARCALAERLWVLLSCRRPGQQACPRARRCRNSRQRAARAAARRCASSSSR
jgi:hypothetical protein